MWVDFVFALIALPLAISLTAVMFLFGCFLSGLYFLLGSLGHVVAIVYAICARAVVTLLRLALAPFARRPLLLTHKAEAPE